MNNQIKLFYDRIAAAFDQSHIKSYANENNHSWYYYLTSTRLTKESTVLVGFNGGAAGDYKYSPHTIADYPNQTFGDLYKAGDELGSFNRVYEPLKQRLPNEDLDSFVQLNFCFFRSKSEGQLSAHDLELCRPIFEDVLAYLNPKRLIGFSSKLRDYLGSKYPDNFKWITIKSNDRLVYVAKGYISNEVHSVPFIILPHPNAQISAEAREEAWNLLD